MACRAVVSPLADRARRPPRERVHALLISNDGRVAGVLGESLARHGISILGEPSAGRGSVALGEVDLVLLDVGHDGTEAADECARIQARSEVPVIVLSATTAVGHRVRALRAGADDYLVKPYNVDELAARIEVTQRRRRGDLPVRTSLSCEDVEINLIKQTVRVAGRPVELPRKDFQILALIAAAGGAVCTRERIVTEVWGESWPGADATLYVHLGRLRTKLGRPGMIETVRGIGYRLSRANGKNTSAS
jgi:DNA-binding response OmpR family regulator